MNKTVFKMAVKNLFANKAKMIITLSLIGIGTFLIILGLGILNFALQQTRDVCISDFSGDILITGKSEEKGVTVELLGAMQAGVRFKAPKMPYLMPFEKIKAKLETMPELSGFTRSIISSGMLKPADLPDSWNVKDENRGSYPFLQTLGVEPVQYQKVFPTAKVYEGSYPTEDGAAFLLLPEDIKQKYEKYYERTLNIGDEVVMTGFSGKTRQQKAVVTGFFTYAHPDTAVSGIGYIDVNTCRIFAGMTLGARTAAAIPESIDLSLTEKSEDDLFGADEEPELISTIGAASKKTDFDNLLGSTELRNQLNLADNEAWHHIAIKLHDSAKTASVIQSLNEWFEAEGINAIAVDWEGAMYSYVTAISATRVLFISMLIILSVVVLIVIMNTLVVAVMQRNAEIGTMRAIGAKKSFVRKIFFTESFFMSLTGVCIGVVLALIAAVIINSFDIQLNEILSAMFGGKKIQVSISLMSIAGTMAAMLLAGLAANWYPVRLALKISPLEAINK